jgi:hypothetical protein
MNTPTLGNARFVYKATHTISDNARIPERIEVGSEHQLAKQSTGD